MTAGTAGALAKAVDDLHYETRQSKVRVLAELVDVALDHLDEVRDNLSK